MYDSDLTIFSVFHKEYPSPNCSFIKPIQVGKPQSKLNLSFLSDDTGDNIADKNDRFCEATALYWIWKNLEKIDSKYIGLAHYRRYFTLPEIRIKRKFWGDKKIEDNAEIYSKPISDESLNQISSPEIKNVLLNKLKESQIILAKPSIIGGVGDHFFNIKDQYIYFHLFEDWVMFEQTLEKLYPADYEFAKTFFSSRNTMHCYNMFIAEKSFIADYCTWLFPILFELEKNIKLSPHIYQNRAIAFLSERLLNLYIYKNKLSIAEMPVMFFT
jgi:hypothetical protein